MTPREKAMELYNRFKKTLHVGTEMRVEANPFVVECCINTVDEIINSCTNDMYPLQGHPMSGYWQEVKQEIEKL